jgi:hypothetical protein
MALQMAPGIGKQAPIAAHPADSRNPHREPMPQSASVEQVPAPPPASPTPELPLEPLLLDPEPLPDPEPAPLLEPELPSKPLLLDELPLLLEDDVAPVTPASPFPLFEPELPQPVERPTRAASVVSVASVAPSHSFTTSW